MASLLIYFTNTGAPRGSMPVHLQGCADPEAAGQRCWRSWGRRAGLGWCDASPSNGMLDPACCTCACLLASRCAAYLIFQSQSFTPTMASPLPASRPHCCHAGQVPPTHAHYDPGKSPDFPVEWCKKDQSVGEYVYVFDAAHSEGAPGWVITRLQLGRSMLGDRRGMYKW